MELDAALCEAVSTRDGLLHVLGAGICRIYRPSFPADLGFDLAVLATLEGDEVGKSHSFTIDFRGPDDAVLATIGGEFGMSVSDGLGSVSAPLAFSVRAVVLPAAGPYVVDLRFGGAKKRLRFFAVQRAP